MTSKKRIVIVSAVFHPRNSPRANRSTELAKEMARLGHDVTVYSVLGDYQYSDFEKSYNVKVRSLGEMKFVTLRSDVDSQPKASLFRSVYLRILKKLIEYPSIELSFKVARLLKDEKNIDLLITIAVPYSIHWGAAYVSKRFSSNNINTWVADCGDPYMGNTLSKRLGYFKYVEKWFCRKVDYLTIPVDEARVGYYQEFQDKIRVIPQGFNFNDVQVPEKKVINPVITFIYAGIFYKDYRDPRPFLQYLSEQNRDFKFIVFTRSRAIVEKYKATLGEKLDIRDYIPRHDLLKVMSQADFLVNFENNTTVHSPSKLIDYALSRRPILSVKSSGLDKSLIDQFLSGDYSGRLIINDIQRYNITNVAHEFLGLIKR